MPAFAQLMKYLALISIASVMLPATAGTPMARAEGAKQSEQFTKGHIEFKQGGKVFTVPLQKGRLEALPLNFGKKPEEIRNLTLVYAGNDMDKVWVQIVNVSGPKKYGKKNIGSFSVKTERGGHSILRNDKGDCTFALSRVDKTRIEGTGACRGPFDDGRGGQAPVVSEVKFTALP